MSDDFETDPHFIDVDGDLGGEGMGVLSRNAFQLFGFGVIHSVNDGTPGFVSDEYLNSIAAETTIPAAELEAAGLWERRDGGYFVLADEMVKTVINQNEEMARLKAECAARGEHVAHEPDGSGWTICQHCGIPLEQPDGGPVALPGGGALGPDLREGR